MGAISKTAFTFLAVTIFLYVSVASATCKSSLHKSVSVEQKNSQGSSETIKREWKSSQYSSKTRHSKTYKLDSLPNRPEIYAVVDHEEAGLLNIRLGASGDETLKKLTIEQQQELKALTKDVITFVASYIHSHSSITDIRIELCKNSRKMWENYAFPEIKFTSDPYKQSSEIETGAVLFSTIVLTPLTMLATAIITYCRTGFSDVPINTFLSPIASIFGGTIVIYAVSATIDYVSHIFKHESFAQIEVTQEFRNNLRQTL